MTSSRLQRIFWLSLVVKLVLATLIPLTNDEAYYWVWSQHMQWSYYDHPPFVAWLFWLGRHMPEFGCMVRWPAVLLGQGTLALWLLILEPFFDEEQRIYWLLLALLSPLIGGTNLLVTPDLPLLFFNALSLLIFYQWRKKSDLVFGLGFWIGHGPWIHFQVCDGFISAKPVAIDFAFATGAQSHFFVNFRGSCSGRRWGPCRCGCGICSMILPRSDFKRNMAWAIVCGSPLGLLNIFWRKSD